MNTNNNHTFRVVNGFVLYLDILGFSQLVELHPSSELSSIVQKMFCDFNRAIDKSRTFEDSQGVCKIKLDCLHCHLVSDSIVIWTENNTFNNFRHLMNSAQYLMISGFKSGLPLRGAIGFGDFVVNNPIKETQDTKDVFFPDEALYGEAYCEAYYLESKLEWSGCVLSQNAWNRVCECWSQPETNDSNPHSYFYRYPHLIWYPVPTKMGKIYAIAINWNSLLAWKNVPQEIDMIINEKIIQDSFLSYGKKLPVNDMKLNETLKFYVYSSSYCDMLPPEGDNNSSKSIPEPPLATTIEIFLNKPELPLATYTIPRNMKNT